MDAGGVGTIFTGFLIEIERVPSRPPGVSAVPDLWGKVVSDLLFSRDAPRLTKPIPCTRAVGAADLVYVKYLDDRRIIFAARPRRDWPQPRRCIHLPTGVQR